MAFAVSILVFGWMGGCVCVRGDFRFNVHGTGLVADIRTSRRGLLICPIGDIHRRRRRRPISGRESWMHARKSKGVWGTCTADIEDREAACADPVPTRPPTSHSRPETGPVNVLHQPVSPSTSFLLHPHPTTQCTTDGLLIQSQAWLKCGDGKRGGNHSGASTDE